MKLASPETQVKDKETDVNDILGRYITAVFPSVYHTESRWRLYEEVVKHHRYLSVLSTHEHMTDTKRIIIMVQLMTVQSMLMFILAFVYEIQVLLLVDKISTTTTTPSHTHLICSLLIVPFSPVSAVPQ